MNASDQLLDLLTIRQLLLERIIAGQNIELNKQLDSVAADILKSLKGKELTGYQGRRLSQAINELASTVKVTAPSLDGMAASESSFINGAFANVGIDAVIPPAKVINEIAKSSLVQGATMGQWFSRLEETTRFNVSRAVKNGVVLGLTNSQIAKTIMGVGDKGGEPIAKARRDAVAITRTATQTIANDVHMASYMENADIIKGLQWVSTLDSRTSDICMARAGKTWSFPDLKPINHSIPWGGGPPAHWSCRSTSIPITRSMAEITGKAEDQIAPRTRASMDGYVASDLTFDQFLKNKPAAFADDMLGKGRAQLWREGKMTLSQLLDQRGNPLTLAQLQSRYGSKVVVKPPKPKPATPTPVAPARRVRFDPDAPPPAPPMTTKAMDSVEAAIARTAAYKRPAELVKLEAESKASLSERNAFVNEHNRKKDWTWKSREMVAVMDARRAVLSNKINELVVAERPTLLATVAVPVEVRGVAADIITGVVSKTVTKQIKDAAEIVAKLVHKDLLPTVRVNIKRGEKARASYNDFTRTINVNSRMDLSTFVHEIVHDIEFQHPRVSTLTKEFLFKRGGGNTPKRLRQLDPNHGYGLNEITLEDAYVTKGGSNYMGRVYVDQATEILTMGIERLLHDPREFLDNDPEYFRFILKIFNKAY